jgi:hypothetical protein
MIAELIAGVSPGFAIINGLAAYYLYLQYRLLSEETVEFAGQVLSLIREENGEMETDPVVLAETVMDHMSQMSGIVK